MVAGSGAVGKDLAQASVPALMVGGQTLLFHG